MTGGPKLNEFGNMGRPKRKPEHIQDAFLDSWVFEDDAWYPLAEVRRLWVMDHVDSGVRLPAKEHTKGAALLKERGARVGRVKGQTVLRGVRPVDDREELLAIHALVTSCLVPLQEAMRARREAGEIRLPWSPFPDG
jgi:hypothetical protein